MNLEDLTLTQVSDLLAAKELSPVEYTQNVIRQIHDKWDLNAVVTLDEELALCNAAQSEKRYLDGTARSPLEGVPVAVKDIIDTKDLVTTYGCQAYAAYQPKEDAFVIKRLKQAGVNVSIKCNTSQFALGPTGEGSFAGVVKNARNPAYTTGGSSSGSASAVAGRLVPGALGTDSGGSIRVPSSICGTVGIKPTFSLVSNQGVMPVSETVDCIGPITRTVEDGAMILQAIAGYNMRDWRSAPVCKTDYSARLGEGVEGTQAVVVTNLFEGPVMPEVSQGAMHAVAVLRELGTETREARMREVSDLRKAHQLSMLAMAYTFHRNDIAAHREDIYDEVYERLSSGKIPLEDCLEYEMRKNEMRGILCDLMGDADCLVYPTTPLTACKIGESRKPVQVNGTETCAFTANGALTWAASYACMPCISLPVAFTQEGLPVGLSLLGKPFDEQNLIRIAKRLQDALALPV
ncbi:MAG: Asp-tRNA(Asn)/Glu-tRNA(Gln) amidotransferase GatCAB subunit [Oscillospiraceae bacterium]|nr:Asp-tRNA(Asn)/Glu-tRNA(Gln) amidotransferase GatCAB subunit [Oscillospiraceae bacterium]